jgi:hypothetical protein
MMPGRKPPIAVESTRAATRIMFGFGILKLYTKKIKISITAANITELIKLCFLSVIVIPLFSAAKKVQALLVSFMGFAKTTMLWEAYTSFSITEFSGHGKLLLNDSGLGGRSI